MAFDNLTNNFRLNVIATFRYRLAATYAVLALLRKSGGDVS